MIIKYRWQKNQDFPKFEGGDNAGMSGSAVKYGISVYMYTIFPFPNSDLKCITEIAVCMALAVEWFLLFKRYAELTHYV